MQALICCCVTQAQAFSLLAVQYDVLKNTLILLQIGEKAMGLSLHVDCVLACSAASGSGFGLSTDVVEKIKRSGLFSFVELEIRYFQAV